jgi:RNA polymerase sigma factor (sigma-70 family)
MERRAAQRRNLTADEIEAEYRKHERLVYHVTRRWDETKWLSREDAEQHARLALLQAILYFDPAKGHRFSTFAVTVITYALKRVYARAKRRNIECSSLDLLMNDGDEAEMIVDFIETPGPEAALECSEAVALAWELVPHLRSKYQEIIRLRYSPPGMTTPEAARVLGIKLSCAESRELRAIRELRRLREEKLGLVCQ